MLIDKIPSLLIMLHANQPLHAVVQVASGSNYAIIGAEDEYFHILSSGQRNSIKASIRRFTGAKSRNPVCEVSSFFRTGRSFGTTHATSDTFRATKYSICTQSPWAVHCC